MIINFYYVYYCVLRLCEYSLRFCSYTVKKNIIMTLKVTSIFFLEVNCLWIVRVIDVKNANTIEHACDRKGRRKRKSIKGDEEIQLYAKFELQKK